jgi:transposase
MSDRGHTHVPDWRDRKIAELEAQLRVALRTIDELRQRILQLEAQDAALRERLGQNSGNSSRPPSSDPPSLPARGPKARSGRRPGGQPGHGGHQRALVPVEKVNRLKHVKPGRCRKCRAALTGDDPNPRRHQVVELARILTRIFEWQLHALTCPRCGTVTRAQLPPGVPLGNVGPRLVATVAMMTGAYRLSKRLAVDFMRNILGVPMSLGSVTACEQLASDALSQPVRQAREFVKSQPIKHADESGWFEGPRRARAWLWTVSTTLVTVFMIQASRGKDVASMLLGEALGVLITDRWSAYAWWPLGRRQLCWAHIKRHFQRMKEAGGRAGRIGAKLVALEQRLFGLWHRVRDGTLERSSFRTLASRIRCQVRALLEEGMRCPHAWTASTCSELLAVEKALWTFARVEGVEPTNNTAERAIRPGVIWRKISFGTHSVRGSRYVERVLTVVQTLRQQERNAYDFIHDCVRASQSGAPPPGLIPSDA